LQPMVRLVSLASIAMASAQDSGQPD